MDTGSNREVYKINVKSVSQTFRSRKTCQVYENVKVRGNFVKNILN